MGKKRDRDALAEGDSHAGDVLADGVPGHSSAAEYGEVVGEDGDVYESFDAGLEQSEFSNGGGTSTCADMLDREEYLDAWLEGISARDTHEARRLHERLDRPGDSSPARKMSLDEACQGLLDALPSDSNNVTVCGFIATLKDTDSIDRVTEYVFILLDYNIFEAYELTRADLVDLQRALSC